MTCVVHGWIPTKFVIIPSETSRNFKSDTLKENTKDMPLRIISKILDATLVEHKCGTLDEQLQKKLPNVSWIYKSGGILCGFLEWEM